MADGKEIPKHGLQIPKIDVEPIITNLFGIWRPGLVLTPSAEFPVIPWVLIPEDGELLDQVKLINAQAHEAVLGAHRSRRAAKQRKP